MENMLPISVEIWNKKYKDKYDKTIQDTWRRVARWAASIEIEHKLWEKIFYDILEDFTFIPGGRITEAAGTVNPYANNCFFLDIEDDLEQIFDTVKRVAMISKKNGGTGLNFSKIRPINAPLSGGGTGSGVVSFMRIFDVACDVIKTGSKNRRAALIGILDVSHPEIFDFIDAKRKEGNLTNFNISVAITDKFMEAVDNDAMWNLEFNGKVYQTVKARDLFDKLCYSGWMYNDPGMIFIDTVNADNNLYYIMDFNGCNPCGELPLFPWGACCLGNINLTKFIINPFGSAPDAISACQNFDWKKFEEVIGVATRFLDNIIDVSAYPYPENREIAERDRRIGLNCFAGLGDALAMLRLPYDSIEGKAFVNFLGNYQKEAVYVASILLSKEKGPFKSFDCEKYLRGGFVKNLSDEIRQGIRDFGIRNCASLTCPPVGTGSMLARNISSGMEPIFAREFWRDFLQPDGTKTQELMEDYAWSLWKHSHEYVNGVVPEFFRTSMDIDPSDHISMQSYVQSHVDGAISKTANLPAEYTLEDYKEVILEAYNNGLKGFTTFRDGTREGVLSLTDKNIKNDPKVVAEPAKFSRPDALDGKTYRIPESGGENAYVTINWSDHQGEKLPWEIFVTRSGSNAEWYAAVGRLASRLMRKTGDVQGVIDELKHIGGDNGYLTQQYGFVKSKPQHIALILEDYVASLANKTVSTEKVTSGEVCDECGGAIVRNGGCNQCVSCGYSMCG